MKLKHHADQLIVLLFIIAIGFSAEMLRPGSFTQQVTHETNVNLLQIHE